MARQCNRIATCLCHSTLCFWDASVLAHVLTQIVEDRKQVHLTASQWPKQTIRSSLVSLSSPYSPSLSSSPAVLRILNRKINSKRRTSQKRGFEFSTLSSRKEQTFFLGAANIDQIVAKCKNLYWAFYSHPGVLSATLGGLPCPRSQAGRWRF